MAAAKKKEVKMSASSKKDMKMSSKSASTPDKGQSWLGETGAMMSAKKTKMSMKKKK